MRKEGENGTLDSKGDLINRTIELNNTVITNFGPSVVTNVEFLVHFKGDKANNEIEVTVRT